MISERAGDIKGMPVSLVLVESDEGNQIDIDCIKNILIAQYG